MAVSEKRLREQRLKRAKDALRQAVETLPPSVKDGGTLRVAAWKDMADKAQQLLRRDSSEAWKYEQALRNLLAIDNETTDRLAIRAYGSKEQRNALQVQA